MGGKRTAAEADSSSGSSDDDEEPYSDEVGSDGDDASSVNDDATHMDEGDDDGNHLSMHRRLLRCPTGPCARTSASGPSQSRNTQTLPLTGGIEEATRQVDTSMAVPPSTKPASKRKKTTASTSSTASKERTPRGKKKGGPSATPSTSAKRSTQRRRKAAAPADSASDSDEEDEEEGEDVEANFLEPSGMYTAVMDELRKNSTASTERLCRMLTDMDRYRMNPRGFLSKWGFPREPFKSMEHAQAVAALPNRPVRQNISVRAVSKSEYPDAAVKVLQQTDRTPLHYRDLTKRTVDSGLLDGTSTNVHVTMNSQLNRCLDFYNAGHGYFGLMEWRHRDAILQVLKGKPVAEVVPPITRPRSKDDDDGDDGDGKDRARHGRGGGDGDDNGGDGGNDADKASAAGSATSSPRKGGEHGEQQQQQQAGGSWRKAGNDINMPFSAMLPSGTGPVVFEGHKLNPATVRGTQRKVKRWRGTQGWNEHWKTHDRPNMGSIHKTYHLGMGASSQGRCATGFPHLQVAMGSTDPRG
ncbi:hypothetical protein PTSG_08618 [Salpingoeca rosetta]|uniref:HTH HARE-type domain-containing protein n=1 Tax=Salpingoeca rosetta (strain ATCC 50818 / BSB-021) TaxID=946362 RepID=F2UK71_SALR5|nr:uncharacterized protein PTSG_08618 [Salpingoeca rosetta]EGD77520.1 hypothetical protein PTSG_08618 [Salpingoeca rosetta]|eukprot:XP_004990408.1 hypothetical protein PTSG_08618 [Salpingoeca rosetta]